MRERQRETERERERERERAGDAGCLDMTGSLLGIPIPHLRNLFWPSQGTGLPLQRRLSRNVSDLDKQLESSDKFSKKNTTE